MKTAWIWLSVGWLAGGGVGAAEAGRASSSEKSEPGAVRPIATYVQDVQYLLEELPRRAGHFFELKGIDWSRVSEQFREEVKSVQSDAGHVKLCQRLLARLRDGHAGLAELKVPWPDESQGRRWTGPCLHLLTQSNRVYVRLAFGPAAEEGLRPGMEIIRIDGLPARAWLDRKVEEMRDTRGYSTDQQALYAACHWGMADWAGTPIPVEVRMEGQPKTVTLVRRGGSNFVPYGPVFPPKDLRRIGRQSYGRTAAGFGYVHLRDVPGNLPEQLDVMLKAIGEVPGLILDMRANGGGGCDHAAVFGRFVPGGQRWRHYPSAGAKPFAGPLVVMVDPGTRSAGETVAGMFKEDGRAYMIGEGPTAGTSSQKDALTVPSGLVTVRFSVRSNMQRFNQMRGIEGIGVPPHEVVPYQPEQLLKDVDTQIQRAEELLRDGFPPGSVPYGSGVVAGSDAPLGPVVTISNCTGRLLRSTPVTFGQVFRSGDFPRGVQLLAEEGVESAQVDIKRRYADGSIRFAVISTVLGQLAPGQVMTLAMNPDPTAPANHTLQSVSVTPQPKADNRHGLLAGETEASDIARRNLLAGSFEVVVRFGFPDGVVRTVRARRLLERAAADARFWLHGPVATEWLLSGAPEDDEGRPDPDLCVRFQVRSYPDASAVRVSVAVENCWDTWAGNIRYDVRITSGGRVRFQREDVDHRPLSRWRQVFWVGSEEPPVHVRHDPAYLAGTGALPNYDPALPELAVGQRREDSWSREGPEWDILGRGPLTAYMPTTGGRPEIAPYPRWAVRYLLTMDPQAKGYVLAAGDLAGSWPVHVRARETDRIMTIDRRPEFWLDERGRDRPQWQAARHKPDSGQPKLTPDLAHQPSLAYIPYLLTGDYYYWEEASFWADYCLLSTWPHPRENARGILAGQIRGDAWALRNLADAAWIAPEGAPELEYFEEKIRNNLNHRTQLMYGLPEYNGIGAWGLRTVEDARIQNPANPRWLITAPWEEDYLLWSLHHLVELGWDEAARPRDFLLRLRVGLLTHAPEFDPQLATPYRLVVGEQGPNGKPLVYEDWTVLGGENAKLSKPDVPNYGNSYAYSARAALVCGIDAGFPNARRALEVLESMLAGHRQVMARDPYWAMAPRGE